MKSKILSFKDFVNEKKFVPNPNIELEKKSKFFSQEDDVFVNDKDYKFEDRKSTGVKFCHLVKDKDSSFTLYLDEKNDKVGMEYYSGENYTVGSKARSHSRRFDVKDIPKVYQNQFKEMVKAFEYHFKIDLSKFDSEISKYKEVNESFSLNLEKSLEKLLIEIKKCFSIDGGNCNYEDWESIEIFKNLKYGPDLYRNINTDNNPKIFNTNFYTILNAYEKNSTEIENWFKNQGFRLNHFVDGEIIIFLNDDYIEKFYETKSKQVNEKYSSDSGEFKATYGGSKKPCIIYVYDGWYAVEDSTNINYAGSRFEFYDGIDIEEIEDADTFQSSKKIDSVETLIEEVDDFENN